MFPNALTRLWNFDARSKSRRCSRPGRQAYQPRLEPFEDRLVPSTIVFQDNMENGTNGWVATGGDGHSNYPSTLWNQTANLRSNSPSTAWHYGSEHDYGDHVTPGTYTTGYTKPDPHCTPTWGDPCQIFVETANWGALTSPAISLAGYTQVTLAFAEWSQVEPDPRYDRTIVEVSTGSNKFTPVFESHGTNGAWMTRVVDLSSYAGKTIQVRFRFDTVNAKYNDYEGWYIDDVVVASSPALAINDQTITEVNTGTVNANLTVTLIAPNNQEVTVAYKTVNQTASAGSDYLSASGTLTFLPGQTTRTVTVPIPPDWLAESYKETFLVQLSNPVNAVLLDGQGQVSILDNEPRIWSNGAAVTEGDSGSTVVKVPVTLSAAFDETVTVHYDTVADSAQAGSDYVSVSGTLSFAPGETTKDIDLSIIGDLIRENSQEYLRVKLSNPSSNAMIDPAYTAPITVVIKDNDALPSVSISDVTRVEGTNRETPFTFTLSLSSPSEVPVSVWVTFGGGTADRWTDYGPDQVYGTFIFAAGQTSLSYTIVIAGDSYKEPTETFFVDLASPTNATIADAQGVGTILDDDTVPVLSINDVQIVEGNRGTTFLVFTVTLSAAISQEVSVNYATANGTATAGTDYKAASGTLTFAPGVTTKTITIEIMSDTLKEANETFFINLSGAINAGILDGQGLASILDDERK